MKTITSFYQLTEEEKQQLMKQYMDEHSKNTEGNPLVPEKPRMLLIQRHRRLRNTLILTSAVVLLVGGLSIYAAGTVLPYKQVEAQPYTDRQTGQKLGTYSGWVNYFGGNPAGAGAVTLPDGTVFHADWSSLFGNTVHENEYCTFPNGSSYRGEFGTALYPSGAGTYFASSGAMADGFWTWTAEQAFKTEDNDPDNDCLYTGMILNGQRHGYGVNTYADGDVFAGEWADDERNGYGKSTYSPESFYEGEYRNDMKNGHGKIVLSTGDVYDGEWKDGDYHGTGTYFFANGDVYEGDWQNGKCTGKGIKTYANGDVYDGEFKDGVRSGQGTYTWADGDVYEGEFKDGVSNGTGTYTWADGRVYKGEYKDDKKNGQGTMTYTDGTVESGLWENDTYIGPAGTP